MNRNSISLLCSVVFVAIAIWLYGLWMRPPVVEHDNLRYIQLLRTAVSAKNPAWLAGVEKAIDLRRSEDAISVAEERHFRRIIELAKTGDWSAADRAGFEFERAQLSRRRTPAVPEHRHHDHSKESSHTHSGEKQHAGSSHTATNGI